MLPAPVVVRRASRTDLAPLATLFDAYRRFYGQTPDAPGARAFLADRLDRGESVLFLAALAVGDGDAVGFAQLYPSFSSVAMAPTLVLNDLFVAPGARRHGVGRALLHAVTAHARGAGACRVELATARHNAAALRLYGACGYVADAGFTHMRLAL